MNPSLCSNSLERRPFTQLQSQSLRTVMPIPGSLSLFSNGQIRNQPAIALFWSHDYPVFKQQDAFPRLAGVWNDTATARLLLSSQSLLMTPVTCDKSILSQGTNLKRFNRGQYHLAPTNPRPLGFSITLTLLLWDPPPHLTSSQP